MNGAHDLGGMHGLGPINAEPEAEEPTFHTEWERRVFGFTLAAGFLGKWNIDMSRHSRERQHPVDYFRHTYYENWLAGLEKLLVETGLITPDELSSGKAERPADESIQNIVPKAKDMANIIARGNPVEMETNTPPCFKTGDIVRAINQHPIGHTREPLYVRGRVGIIHEHYGAHVFPDRNAEGLEEGRHLYSVRFKAETLWGKNTSSRSAVYVDLWEDYLEPV
jgi:nitrile hydratase